MAMAADITDAVVGVDTHRDTHSLQIATAGGVPIAQCTVLANILRADAHVHRTLPADTR